MLTTTPGHGGRRQSAVTAPLNPYADPDYRAALEMLKREQLACVHRGPTCSGLATTPDHVPPIAEHRHVRGSGCCRLVPSCAPCNYRRGAQLGNRRRRRSSPTRLAPGSGSL